MLLEKELLIKNKKMVRKEKIKKEMNNQEQTHKKAYLPKNSVACGIVKIIEKGKGFEIVKAGEAICSLRNGIATDLLTPSTHEYVIYDDPNPIKEAVKNGNLVSGDTFCYSHYDCDLLFPEIKTFQTKAEVIEFLINYNRNNNIALYWTFLDKDEVEELDKIVKENAKKYPNLSD